MDTISKAGWGRWLNVSDHLLFFPRTAVKLSALSLVPDGNL